MFVTSHNYNCYFSSNLFAGQLSYTNSQRSLRTSLYSWNYAPGRCCKFSIINIKKEENTKKNENGLTFSVDNLDGCVRWFRRSKQAFLHQREGRK